MGTGNDLYGEDYTKAAIRAVQDAMHHSSLTLFKSLDIDPNSMTIDVTIAVQQPAQIDKQAIARQLPYGTVTVKPVYGGLNVPDSDNNTVTVIATAAITAMIDRPDTRFRL